MPEVTTSIKSNWLKLNTKKTEVLIFGKDASLWDLLGSLQNTELPPPQPTFQNT